MSSAIQARLQSLRIELAAEAKGFCVFVRDDVFALAPRDGESFGVIGSTGMVTPNGLAYLTWRNERALLAAKGIESPATPEQVDRITRFSRDLESALTRREE